MLMGKIFCSKIKGGQGSRRIGGGGWKSQRGTEGGSSLRAKEGRNRGEFSTVLNILQLQKDQGRKPWKKGTGAENTRHSGRQEVWNPVSTPFVCVCKSAPLVMGPKHLPATVHKHTCSTEPKSECNELPHLQDKRWWGTELVQRQIHRCHLANLLLFLCH